MTRPEWKDLKFLNPTQLLLGLDSLFADAGLHKYRNPADLLQHRDVREIAEDRRCAIFCHGASQALGTKILFAPFESSDYDYVGAFSYGGRVHQFPIQLKQVAPSRLNPRSTISKEIAKLRKYVDSHDLIVAMHINQSVHLKPSDIDVSGLHIKELWLFSKLSSDPKQWLLLGNLMGANPIAYSFQLPMPD
ncbi:hypothetical protein [Pseudoxanthomonas sp. LARHCG66]